jgi:hypothetical protein
MARGYKNKKRTAAKSRGAAAAVSAGPGDRVSARHLVGLAFARRFDEHDGEVFAKAHPVELTPEQLKADRKLIEFEMKTIYPMMHQTYPNVIANIKQFSPSAIDFALHVFRKAGHLVVKPMTLRAAYAIGHWLVSSEAEHKQRLAGKAADFGNVAAAFAAMGDRLKKRPLDKGVQEAINTLKQLATAPPDQQYAYNQRILNAAPPKESVEVKSANVALEMARVYWTKSSPADAKVLIDQQQGVAESKYSPSENVMLEELRIANAIATNAPIENKAEAERVAAVVEGKASIGTAAVAHVLDKSVDEIYQEPGFLKRQLAKIGNAFGAGKFDELLADNEHDTVVTQATLQGEEPGILAQVGNAFITKQDDDIKHDHEQQPSFLDSIIDRIHGLGAGKRDHKPAVDIAAVKAYDKAHPEPAAKPALDAIQEEEPSIPSVAVVLADPKVQAEMKQNHVSVAEVKHMLDLAHLQNGMPNILEAWLQKTRGMLRWKTGQTKIAQAITGRYDSIRGVNDILMTCNKIYTVKKAFENAKDTTVYQIISALALLYDAKEEKTNNLDDVKQIVMKELQQVCEDVTNLRQAMDDYYHYKRAVYMCKLSICTAFKSLLDLKTPTEQANAAIELTRGLLFSLKLLVPKSQADHQRFIAQWPEQHTNVVELMTAVKSNGLVADLLWIIAMWNYAIRYTVAAQSERKTGLPVFYWLTSRAGGAKKFNKLGLRLNYEPDRDLQNICNNLRTIKKLPAVNPTLPLNLMLISLHMMFTPARVYNYTTEQFNDDRLILEGDAATVIAKHLAWIVHHMPADANDNKLNFSGESARKVLFAAEADLESRELKVRDGNVPSRGFVKKVKSKPNPAAASKGAAPRKLMGKSAAVKSIQVEGARQITVSQPYATTTGSARGSASYY